MWAEFFFFLNDTDVEYLFDMCAGCWAFLLCIGGQLQSPEIWAHTCILKWSFSGCLYFVSFQAGFEILCR
jgi:hypothetical protein